MTRDPPASPECSQWRAGKGFKGYMPIVGHIAENGLVLGDAERVM